MMTKAVRWIYSHRSLLKRLIPIRRPLLLDLADFKMYVRLDDWAVGARIAVKRNYEAHVTATMRSLLQRDMVVVDVGANIGYYTLLAASKVGNTGKVIAFEPSSQNCDLLRMSIAANNFSSVIVHSCAVADTDRVVGFNMSDSNGAINRKNPIESAYQVQAVKLDTFLKGESRIDLVKLDIEGAEGLALRGMQSLLQDHRPTIFTEFSPAALETNYGITPRQYLSILFDLGYELFVIDRNKGKDSHPQSYEQIMLRFANIASEHLDLVAYPREKHPTLA